MTELIERYKIDITLNHDQVDSAVYSGGIDLKQCLHDIWPDLARLITAMPCGRMQFVNGGIEVRFERSGLEEAPELGGGDN